VKIKNYTKNPNYDHNDCKVKGNVQDNILEPIEQNNIKAWVDARIDHQYLGTTYFFQEQTLSVFSFRWGFENFVNDIDCKIRNPLQKENKGIVMALKKNTVHR